MYPLLTSVGVVAVSEIGDKTQLLALLLAARFRRPVPIIAGILVATLANHAAAALAGEWVSQAVPETVLRWALAILFLGMAAWALVPDRIDEADGVRLADRAGPFLATAVSFFLAEMGDKTQIATAALAARFGTLVPVVLGTTIGMLLADVPAVLVGDRAGTGLDLRYVRWGAAVIFALLGIFALPW